jgi:hypothetical protein
VGSAAQVRGDLPPQRSRVALESVVFVEEARREEELGSVLADIIAHLGQDVSTRNSRDAASLVFTGWFTGLVPWCMFLITRVSQSGVVLQ